MKTNLVLLHGAIGSKAQLVPLEKLLNKQYNVFIFNFDGHGGRTTEKEYSIELFADNCKQFMTKHHIQTADIFGYSMGGYVALKLARSHPYLVNRIVTLGTKFEWTISSAVQEVKMLNPNIIEEKIPAFAEHLNKIHAPEDWKVVLKKTGIMMKNLGENNALKKQDFKQILNQVMIMVGDQDQMVSVEESKSVSSVLPNSKFKLLEGVRHPIEKIDFINLSNILKKFFK